MRSIETTGSTYIDPPEREEMNFDRLLPTQNLATSE